MLPYLADAITVSRMVFSLLFLIAVPFSPLFTVCYLLAGFSDMADGFVARRTHSACDRGARLDSIADGVFACCLFVFTGKTIALPACVWGIIAVIAAIKIAGYRMAYCKFSRVISYHTHLNRLTGLLIFSFPLLIKIIGTPATVILVSVPAFLSAVEEPAITLRCEKPDLDCKGYFFVKERKG